MHYKTIKMKIPKTIIEQLHKLNCEEVAKRFGLEVDNHKTRCFKHKDRIPSLSFTGNFWKCFSCGSSGDAIKFIQERFSVTFVEACKILANEYGIYIQEDTNKHINLKISISHLINKKSNNTQVCFDKEIAEYIINNTTLTQSGISFLQEQRKIKNEVINSSKIHSIESTNELQKKLQAKFEKQRLIEAKVLSSNGNHLTINPPSLIIPYYDENENLISLQTRYLGKDNPNYHIPRFKRICNSSSRLYNLSILKTIGNGEQVFITEGITDCLAMLSLGYRAIALPSATSFNIEDLEKLKTYDLYMIADNDNAGNKAFIELRSLMLRYGCEIKDIKLPNNVKDFSEYYLLLNKD